MLVITSGALIRIHKIIININIRQEREIFTHTSPPSREPSVELHRSLSESKDESSDEVPLDLPLAAQALPSHYQFV
jgi:hypothetical protein